jgi:hypothetical protein
MSVPILEQLLGLPHLKITGYELPDATTVILEIKPTLKVALCPERAGLDTDRTIWLVWSHRIQVFRLEDTQQHFLRSDDTADCA